MQTSDMNDANKGAPGLNTLGNSLVKMAGDRRASDSDPKMEQKTEEKP